LNTLELARALDGQDRPIEAAEAYERAINESGGLEAYLNVAAIYFQCADPGYAAHHHLSREFVALAARRFYEVVGQAQERFPDDGEARFWRLYYEFVHLGANDFTEEAAVIASQTGSLIPSFFLFTRPGGERYRNQALQLYHEVSRGGSARDRYIASVLRKHLGVR
jgi:hypothetical protein